MAIAPAMQLAAARARQQANKGYLSPMPRVKITAPRPPNALATIGSDAATSLVPRAAPNALATLGSDAATSLNKGAAPAGSSGGDFQSKLDEFIRGLGLGGSTAQGEIGDQPDFRSGLELFNATQDAAAQTRRNMIRQAFIRSGILPDTAKIPGALSQYAGDLDQLTIDTARGNQFSTQAQLEKGLGEQTAALPYQLAARGMAGSGEAAQRSQQNLQGYEQQSQQNLSSLTDVLGGLEGDFGTAITGARSQWENTQRDIASRLAQTQGSDFDPEAVVRGLAGLFGGEENTSASIPPTPQRPYVPPRPSLPIQRALQSGSPLTRARAAARAGYISVPVSQIRGRR